jgi:hypothetical protein
MEVKITISDTAGSTTSQGTTTIQIGRSATPGLVVQSEAGAPVTESGSNIEAGAALGGATAMGQLTATGSPLEPPAEVLRTAAAVGALSAGPAPTLTGLTMGVAPGEPVPFTAAGLESATMAAIGSPDQVAGAAPGTEQSAPVEIIEESRG